MGTTKRIAEMYCQYKNQQAKTTCYSMVRFGNVLGSTGSVLPLFREQLKHQGPLTVTHPEMTRYFMMIPDAASLILQSFLLCQGGEIFVLDMGEPVKIIDLAEKLITLSGQQPYKDIDIVFSGIRPGEKLYEELAYDAETMGKTPISKIFRLNGELAYSLDWISLVQQFRQAYNERSVEWMLSLMVSLVPEYQSKNTTDSDLACTIPQ